MGQSESRTRPRVLVVDDDQAVLWMLEVALRHHGFDVACAPGGEEAQRLFREAPPDVVLSDVQMPGMDGPATLAALRALDPGVRLVFMSGHSGHHAPEELLALGACAVVEKPFRSLSQLVGLLRRAAQGGGTGDLPL